MDTGSLVENQIEEGHDLLQKLARSGFEVSAAAWVKTADDEKWNLYVVSRTVAEKGLAPAYAESYAALGRVRGSWVSPRELTLVRPDTPVGKNLLEIQRRHGGRIPIRLQSVRLGDVPALEAYVYPELPSPLPEQQSLTPQEVVQKVVGLMGRTGNVRPSRITLRNGTTFLGVPFGLELSGDAMQVKFAVEGAEPPRIYAADAIQAIE